MSVKQLFDLTNKVVLVTGGSRGLGFQMAEAAGEMGGRIVITARKQDELAEAAGRLKRQGVEVLTVAGDLSKPATIGAVVDATVAAYGTVDVLVNNAGASWGAPAEDHPADAWHKVMDLNLNSIFLLSQAVGRRCMIPQRSGKIVNISSIAGLTANPPEMTTISYNTSKAGLLGLTRALAGEWGRHNINVNAICPGFFPTTLSRGLLEKIEAKTLERTPLGRLGGDDDLKGTFAYLASEASRHVTGQYVVVDGGAWIT
jgi:gluconate 5-dehydrogenase